MFVSYYGGPGAEYLGHRNYKIVDKMRDIVTEHDELII